MRILLTALVLVLVTAGAGMAAEEPLDFERDVRPIFQQHCVKCHGAEEQNGGLRYDHRQGALAQGDSGGYAIVPGQPEKSQLLRRIGSTDKEEQMPPKGARLSRAELQTFKAWIAKGAVWPQNATAAQAKDTANAHWSFQPISKAGPPPALAGRAAYNPIDRFIDAQRHTAGLAAAPDAEPITWIRRATYDLTGLPPSPDEVEAFVIDCRQDRTRAVERLINRLLASSRYGERWGRHWMDWVRYADTAGDNSDYPIPQAYLYRNYIIDALNADVPYDRFITEQIAGDLLPAKDQKERNRQTIATGYLAMARRFGSLVERYPWHLTIEDTIDNMSRTMLGLTVSCARCHDHKFDPISTRDYYGLYGIFASTRYPFPGLELFKAQLDFAPLIPKEEAAEKLQPFQAETDKLRSNLEQLLAASEAKALANAAQESSATVDQQRRMKDELDKMLFKARTAGEKLSAHLKKTPVLPTAYAVHDGKPASARIQIKGEPDRPGAEVPRKFIDVLGGQLLPEKSASGSGRLELAQWLTDAANPVTARVIVNRIWQRHFGVGLVSSTSDFGLRGEKPTHPELLDWLAQELMRNGWSLKHLHRLIMTSRTYQLSSRDVEDNLARDPGNRLYWKFNRQRLDAESIRDTLLLISGALDPTPQSEPYPIPAISKWEYTQHHPFKDDYPNNKRSVYQMTKRLTAKPYFQTFDGADPNVCTSNRDRSVTALQALYFMNDTFVHDQATRFANLLISNATNEKARIDRAWTTVLSRPPTSEETALMQQHLLSARQQLAGSKNPEQEAWASLVRSLFRLNEFLYLD